MQSRLSRDVTRRTLLGGAVGAGAASLIGPAEGLATARLASIRPRVAQLAGTPAKLTLTARPQSLTPGGTVTLSGTLARLGGAVMGGAPLEVQTLSHRCASAAPSRRPSRL